eukprot:CAMPEP_0206265054 /NCGR_PEP_ID=MMETSP0047_2-20121206/29768_1 /ASSEMBLY_ACC=CAM_ASM_000192 /TAXON_ID=195065 /ORGANISM="Chroomonas mesostigmatica_cf, Strain CCMP1168" /LENGTH=207 /DNA_ID=CAMNT_0053692879 /DNA_START=66 /DNA_END=685 /DNA_ORIENTATION=+
MGLGMSMPRPWEETPTRAVVGIVPGAGCCRQRGRAVDHFRNDGNLLLLPHNLQGIMSINEWYEFVAKFKAAEDKVFPSDPLQACLFCPLLVLGECVWQGDINRELDAICIEYNTKYAHNGVVFVRVVKDARRGNRRNRTQAYCIAIETGSVHQQLTMPGGMGFGAPGVALPPARTVQNDTNFCGKCGHQNPPNATFCASCGNGLNRP